MIVELGTIVAERRMRVTGHTELDVRVRIGMPRLFPDDPLQNYYCPYQIVGIGSEEVEYVSGGDAFKALELALCALPIELDSLRRCYPGLGYQDCADGDYGFSLVSALRHHARQQRRGD